MAAMKDNLKEFVALRDGLVKEKAQLQERLRQIDAAISGSAPAAAVAAAAPKRRGRPPGSGKKKTVAVAAAPKRRGRPPGSGKKKVARKKKTARKVAAEAVPAKLKLATRKKPGKRIRNKVSLREVVKQVTTNNPMTKPEIIKAVLATGYRFNAADPIPSLNAVLYSNKQFKNDNGKFSPSK